MNFHNVRFPNEIAIYAVGSCKYSTSCAESKSGREVRSLDSSASRQIYRLVDCKLSEQQFETFNTFFRARAGRRFSFRLRDHMDKIAKKQSLHRIEGENDKFQLYKLYNDPINAYSRKITKPVDSGVKLYRNQTEYNDYEIDYNTGIITLPKEVKYSELKASFKFDIQVRFDNDEFDYKFADDGTIMLENVKLIEVI